MTPRHPEGWEPWQPGRRAPLPGLGTVVGHRGAMGRAPENTLASIRAAHRLGADCVEFDVKLTRDNVTVLMHDETLDRTTSGYGLVAAHSFAELEAVDAGIKFDPAFAGEPIARFDAALALVIELGLGVNVEIKACPGREVETGRQVAREILEMWPEDGPPLLVSSFSRAALRAVREVAPVLPLGLLVELIPRDWSTQLQDLGCTALHPWYLPTRSDTVRELARIGVPLLFYTVNDPARAAKLYNAGARAVITDLPDVIGAAAPGRRSLAS